jgi:hypothetical protein
MFKEVENILKPLTDAITMIEGLDIVEAYLKVNQAFDTAYSEPENIVHLGEESKANISRVIFLLVELVFDCQRSN